MTVLGGRGEKEGKWSTHFKLLYPSTNLVLQQR